MNTNDIFASRYRLEQRLGNGGFGEVWRALDTVTGGEVAVKIHLKENDERAAKEILIEYTRVRDIHHDNLLTPTYVGIADGNTPYLVMELCKGDLSDTDLEEPDVWRLLRDVAAGLTRLADNQRTKRRPDGTEVLVPDPIIHQDIKPANILLRSNGMYAISDFGISKRRLSTLSTNSQDAPQEMDSAMTIDYAAPERFPRGKGVAVLASDIWSLGAMLYEVVEGHRPFAECGGDCLNDTIGLSVPAITREGYSDELKQLVYDCMAKNPTDRPTAAQLQDYADRVVKGLPRQHTWARGGQAKAPKTPKTPKPPKPPIIQEDTPSLNRKWLFIGLAIVAAVVLAVVLWLKHGGEEQWVDTMPIGMEDMESIMDSVAVVEEGPSAAVPAPQATSPVAANGGTLTLTSNPTGAAVKVDGKYKGDTPLTLEEQNAGKHTVVFSLEGYESTEKTATVTEGRTATSHADLKKRQTEQSVQQQQPAQQQPSQKPESFSNSSQTFSVSGVSFKMIKVTGGSIGTFYIGETEVTQALWQAVMGRNPSFFKGSNRPVEMVSWNDCQEFVKKLSNMTGKTFRLPKEAEWEYAAKGGNRSRGYEYSGCNKEEELERYAWYDENAYYCGSPSQNLSHPDYATHNVKTKKANELGLYDMSGNVSEWCEDLYDSSGSGRVTRGGSWISGAASCRVSSRRYYTPSERYKALGLRLVLVP